MAWFRRNTSDAARASGPSACPGQQGDIAADVLGSLRGEEQTRLTAHLRTCRGCQAAHEELVPLRDWLSLLSLQDIVTM